MTRTSIRCLGTERCLMLPSAAAIPTSLSSIGRWYLPRLSCTGVHRSQPTLQIFRRYRHWLHCHMMDFRTVVYTLINITVRSHATSRINKPEAPQRLTMAPDYQMAAIKRTLWLSPQCMKSPPRQNPRQDVPHARDVTSPSAGRAIISDTSKTYIYRYAIIALSLDVRTTKDVGIAVWRKCGDICGRSMDGVRRKVKLRALSDRYEHLYTRLEPNIKCMLCTEYCARIVSWCSEASLIDAGMMRAISTF